MKTSFYPSLLIWVALLLLEASIAATGFHLSARSFYTYEKVALGLLGILALALLTASFCTLLLALWIRFQGSGLPYWLPHFFKPLLAGLVGTAAVATPSFANPTAVVQTLETQPSPFFQELTPTSPFFSAPEQGSAIAEHEITPVATTSPAPAPSPFFRLESHEFRESGQTTSPRQHVVLQGQTLWSIAQEQLGPGASKAEILTQAQAIYRANTDQLSSFEALIFPGQILHLP